MIKYSKAIAFNSDLLSAQAFVFSTSVTDLPEYLIVLISAEGEDVFTKIRQLAPQIEQQFFDSSTPASDRLLKLEQLILDQLKSWENIQLLLGYLQAEVLYLHMRGAHQAFLYRNGKASLLSTSGLISGALQKGDKLLFITSNLKQEQNSFWDEHNTASFFNIPRDNLEEEIDLKIKENPQKEPVAAVLLDYFPKDSEESFKPALLPHFSFNLGILKNKKVLTAILLGCIVAIIILGFSVQQIKKNGDKNTAYLRSLDSAKQIAEIDILKVYQVNDWPVFLSLDLVKKDFNPQSMSFSVDKLLLLDTIKPSLISIDVNKKTNQILSGGPNLGQAKFASINGDNVFAFSGDQGIIQIDILSQKLTKIVKPDPEWGNIQDIFAFSGNVYLLDNIKNQIWKYVPIPTGYSQKFTYLNDDQKPNFSLAKKLRIDYSVFVLKVGPEVLRFTGGASDFFSPSSLEQNLGEINNIYVGKNGERVYLLDPTNSRLVVLKNNGQYQAEYLGDKFKTAADLVVDEESKKIYLLEGGKIYQLELK